MIHHRPGGMSPQERAKTLRRLGGGVTPNASGATQEAPAILASSEPSRELIPPIPTPEEIAAVAEANRKAKADAGTTLREADTQNAPDPVNGEVDPMDAESPTAKAIHDAVIEDPPADEPTDSLLD